MPVPPAMGLIAKDDGPRGDSTVASLAALKPAFDRELGLITAGSSSFLTDGGSAVILMSRAAADREGFKARSIVRDYVYAAGDPLESLLEGPALAVPKLLERNGLDVGDVGVWEIHEAFAAQVVANLKLMKQRGVDVPLEKINVWGGSLSIGHPFGATGGRLIITATRRLEISGERYAVVTGCAAGGHGSAILLENPHHKNASRT